MTVALEVGEWSAARPGRTLPPGKTRYPFYRKLGGPQGRSGRAENLVPTGIRSRTVQSIVSRHTDWATHPQSCQYLKYYLNICFKILRNPPLKYQNIPNPGQELNRAPLSSKLGAKIAAPSFSILATAAWDPKKLISFITSLVLKILCTSNDTGTVDMRTTRAKQQHRTQYVISPIRRQLRPLT